jgi:hypothetical protein
MSSAELLPAEEFGRIKFPRRCHVMVLTPPIIRGWMR